MDSLVGRVRLVRLGPVPEGIERGIEKAVRNAFHGEITPDTETFTIDFAFDERRYQYNSTHILYRLERIPLRDHDRILAVTECDLFIPILTYVFGEALLGKPAAIVSTHRLSPTFYGLPPDPDLLRERTGIEAVHELGHTLGLIHCSENTCAMHASHSADAIDLKEPSLCPSCVRQLSTG